MIVDEDEVDGKFEEVDGGEVDGEDLHGDELYDTVDGDERDPAEVDGPAEADEPGPGPWLEEDEDEETAVLQLQDADADEDADADDMLLEKEMESIESGGDDGDDILLGVES